MDVKARLVALAGIAALGAACAEAPEAAPPPPPEVYVMPVVQKDVPTYLELVGQTRGFQDVDVRARVEGFLDAMDHFRALGGLLPRQHPGWRCVRVAPTIHRSRSSSGPMFRRRAHPEPHSNPA